jgi:hypothetical protein
MPKVATLRDNSCNAAKSSRVGRPTTYFHDRAFIGAKFRQRTELDRIDEIRIASSW